MSNCETSVVFRLRPVRPFVVVASAILLLLGSRCGLAGIVTIYSDNFAADPLGNVPVTPVIGEPWVTSTTSPGGIQVVADPYFSTNGLQLGSYRSTVVMPFSTADQASMATNENFTLSFQYHGIASNGFTPYLDISGNDTATGDPAFLFRIMSQPTTPSSGLHEIYYLSPTTGLTDTGLAVPANSLQLLTVSANFANDTSQISVGANTATEPLYMCPSMIQEASLSSYLIGSGGPSYSDIDQVTATTDSSAAGTQPSGQTQTPEPGTLILLLAGAAGPAAWWLWRRRKFAGAESRAS